MEAQDESKREDWCRLGLAQIDDDREFHIMEQFAFDTIKAFFHASGHLPEAIDFGRSISDLKKVISHFQTSTTGKGDIFEDVIFHTLVFCKGKTVSQTFPLSNGDEIKQRRSGGPR